jgi:hypothetical protein
MAGFRKNGISSSGSLKRGELLNQVSDYQLLKKVFPL